MWKNFLLQRRNPIQSVLEVVIPVLFCALLVWLRSSVKPEIHSESEIFKELDFNDFPEHL
jgi:hypothetical protein